MFRVFLLLIVFLANSVFADALRLSEPVQVTDRYEIFGAPMDTEGAAISLLEAMNALEQGDSANVRIRTKVTQVCQKKGCFFIATEGAHWARVTFKDYAFFVPTDSAGKTAVLEGVLTRRTVSEAQRAHYASDLGEDAVSEGAAQEYAIEATSVLLPRA
ncbi:MAG: DUF4920 domain-containing protein [Pseudomonadota bacterium]